MTYKFHAIVYLIAFVSFSTTSRVTYDRSLCFSFFFFNDTATTEIYTLSLHDALPIFLQAKHGGALAKPFVTHHEALDIDLDRKSTRLNSSHVRISYAVFCLKKKNELGVAVEARAHRAALVGVGAAGGDEPSALVREQV